MSNLDAGAVQQSLGEGTTARLTTFEVLAEIDSTNSHLMRRAGPPPGQLFAVVTDNQTHGRGRHGRTWQSPPGSGLCLSIAYTFAAHPANLPALTLAIGLGAIEALADLGVPGVQLKWPNDLIANDGKLGGILTETQPHGSGAITVVTGLGLNVELGENLELASEWRRGVSDLAGIVTTPPSCDELAARLIDGLCSTCVEYEKCGFAGCAHKWPGHDWLSGRELTVETPQQQVTGIGAGIADDGALLVDSGGGEVNRIVSGSVMTTGARVVDA